VIDAILKSDKTAPPEQRHTSKRIFERLRDEHAFGGGYTVVKDYVRLARTRSREVVVPPAHPPGHTQVDFGECIGVIGGARMKLHVFCFDLPHSDACFIKAYAAETTGAFLDSHVTAFAFFGGVPISILHDNTKISVAKILGDGARRRTQAFIEFVSTFYSTIALIARAKATTRARSKGWEVFSGQFFDAPAARRVNRRTEHQTRGALSRPSERTREPT